jgi:hypothetical protein
MDEETGMTDFKQEWTLETAMEILQHPTVDSKIWAEAVEWLMLYGPPEVREMLKTASNYATSKEFPELKPQGYDENGDPVYSVSEVAKALQISEDEAAEIIAAKQEKHGLQQFYSSADTKKVQ